MLLLHFHDLLRLLCPGVEQLKQYYAEVDVILQNIEHTTVPLLVIFKVIGRDGIGTSCNQEQRECPHKIYYNRCLRGLHQIPPPPAPPSSTTRPAVPSPPSTHDHRRSGGLPGHPSKPASHDQTPNSNPNPSSPPLASVASRGRWWPRRRPLHPTPARLSPEKKCNRVIFFSSFVTSLCVFHKVTRGLSS